MGYPAKAVANYFLEKHGDQTLSPLKIQKLVYVAHGWHLAFHDEPLVDNEYVEAWQYGPVFASLYHEFKRFGRKPVLELATETRLDEDNNLVVTTPKIREGDEVRELLDRIWEVYGGHSAAKLSGICHQEGTPWHTARERNKNLINAHIDNEEIKRHYVGKMQRGQGHG